MLNFHSPPPARITIERNGVSHRLAECTIEDQTALETQGLLAPWIDPDPIGFATLTPHEREQVKRLAGATVGYCDSGTGESAPSADER